MRERDRQTEHDQVGGGEQREREKHTVLNRVQSPMWGSIL